MGIKYRDEAQKRRQKTRRELTPGEDEWAMMMVLRKTDEEVWGTVMVKGGGGSWALLSGWSVVGVSCFVSK